MALIRSGLITFNEFLTVGHGCGAAEIGSTVEKWGTLLTGTPDGKDYKSELLVSFARVVVQCSKYDVSVRSAGKMMRKVFMVAQLEEHEKKVLKRVVAGVASGKNKEAVKVMFEQLLAETKNDGEGAAKMLPKTVNELLDGDCADGARVALEFVMGSSTGCKELATFVFKQLRSVKDDEDVLTFEQRVVGCLHFAGNKNAQFEVARILNYYEAAADKTEVDETPMMECVRTLVR